MVSLSMVILEILDSSTILKKWWVKYIMYLKISKLFQLFLVSRLKYVKYFFFYSLGGYHLHTFSEIV